VSLSDHVHPLTGRETDVFLRAAPRPQQAWVGTLGDVSTFAGQAADAAMTRYPWLAGPRYFASIEEVWKALDEGMVDSVILTAETTNTGFTEAAIRVESQLGDYFVGGEIVVPFRCQLLAPSSTRLENVRRVVGHGSIRQCATFLSTNLPEAEVMIHPKNSAAAAEELLGGDGTTALVGTARLAQQTGLSVLASDIDHGSQGSWWIVARRLWANPSPSTVVIGMRVRESVRGGTASDIPRVGAPDGATGQEFQRALEVFARHGFRLRSLLTAGDGVLFGYRYLAVLTGVPDPDFDLGSTIAALPGCYLLGAFATHDNC
jgi:prephenate dehydratase